MNCLVSSNSYYFYCSKMSLKFADVSISEEYFCLKHSLSDLLLFKNVASIT